MTHQADTLELVARIVRTVALLCFYVFTGFGPGFIIGVLLANRLFGKEKPMKIDTHEEKIKQAAEHNKQWNPDDPRWKS